MTDEDEGPRTVHLDPSQLPGGARFRAPVIPKVEPDAHATAGTPVGVGSPAGAGAPPGAGAARGMETQISQVPTEIASHFAAAAPPETSDPRATEPLGPRPPVIRRPGPDRTAFYSSAPRPPGAPASNGPPSAAAPDRATVLGKQGKPGNKRTPLILLIIVVVASLIGAGLALVFGDRIVDLVNNFTG